MIGLSNIQFVPARESDQQSGLLGYLSLVVNGSMRVDGLTLRRTATGDLTVSYPQRRDNAGRTHPLMRPVHDRARRLFEHRVIGELRDRGLVE